MVEAAAPAVAPGTSAIDPSLVRVVDVSALARAIRHIRFGTRFYIGLFGIATLLLVLALGTANLWAALAALTAALLLLAISQGISRYSIATAAAPVAVYGVLLVLYLALIIWAPPPGERGPIFGSLGMLALLWIPMLLPLLALIRYRRSYATVGPPLKVRDTPLQLRLLQNWRKDWRALGALVLCLVAPFFCFFIYAVASDREFLLVTGLMNAPVWFVAAISTLALPAALFSGPFFYVLAGRYAAVSAAEMRKTQPGAPIIFLRSFADDAVSFRVLLRGRVSLEEELARGLSHYGPVIAIGAPGERLAPLGAARDYVSGAEWKARVKDMIVEARAIVMVMGNTPGLQWEIEAIAAAGLLHKLIVIVPPLIHVVDLGDRWQSFTRWGKPFAALAYETIMWSAVAMRLSPSGQLIVVTSKARGDGDYFEAIRHLFSERGVAA
jgi:hypothetical protein